MSKPGLTGAFQRGTMINFYRHTREAQEHADAMLLAARRNDVQAARALGRCAMVSIELAMRELPDTDEAAEKESGR